MSFRVRYPATIEILALTSDDRFFSSLLYVTTQYGWTVHLAKSIDRALEILKRRNIAVVVYDSCLLRVDWAGALVCLSADACVVLAAQEADEGTWQRAIACGAYDVACRTGGAAELAVTLRFACQLIVCRKWTYPD